MTSDGSGYKAMSILMKMEIGPEHWELVLDITEYKKLQQQKDDFISIASHELKTPITSLKASSAITCQNERKSKWTDLFPRLIDQSTRSMGKITELVEDLLNVSKMNEGQIMLKKHWFNVSEMLNKCCNHVREEGKYEFITQGDDTLEIFADEHRIDQVIVNFVNNAVKYALNSTKIYLDTEKIGDNIKLSVRDNGPGIHADQIPHLFDRYFRADPSGMQVSGLGLGLYISADIIKRHGGEIGVDSELGKGSTFWITLPING
jgi:signal transduction histidine kinase